jgi:hypothetical protein
VPVEISRVFVPPCIGADVSPRQLRLSDQHISRCRNPSHKLTRRGAMHMPCAPRGVYRRSTTDKCCTAETEEDRRRCEARADGDQDQSATAHAIGRRRARLAASKHGRHRRSYDAMDAADMTVFATRPRGADRWPMSPNRPVTPA